MIGPFRAVGKSGSPLETALGRDHLGRRRFRSKTVANRPLFPAKYAEPGMTPSEIGFERRLWVFQSRSGSARPGPFRDARKSESPVETALGRDHLGRRRFRSKTVANRPLFPGDAKIAPFPDAIALQNRPLAGAKLTPHAPAPPLSNPSNNTRPPRAILWRMDNRSVAVRRPPCVFLGFEIGGAGVALTHFFPTLAFFRAKNTREKK